MRVRWTVDDSRSRPEPVEDMCRLYDRGMDSFEVTGGARLAGDVGVTGAKNSVLKVMAAALLAEGTTTLTNVPDIFDVPIMSEILRGLGADVTGHAPEIAVTVPAEIGNEADYEHVRRIRGSVCVLGPL